MMEDRTRRIEERAHSLWEMEGRPHGRDAQHWQQAEREIDAEDAAKASAAADTTVRGRKPKPKFVTIEARKGAQESQGPEAGQTADVATDEPARTRGRKPKAAAGDEPEAPKAKRGRPSKAAAETPVAAASASGRGRKPKAAATEGGEAPKATRGRKARAASEAGPVGAAADTEPAPQDHAAPGETKDRGPEADLDTQMSQRAAGTAGSSQTAE